MAPTVRFVLLCAILCTVHSANILMLVNLPPFTSLYLTIHSIAPSLIQEGHRVYSLVHSRTSLPEQARELGIIPILHDTEDYDNLTYTIDSQLYDIVFGNISTLVFYEKLMDVEADLCQNVLDNQTLMDEFRQAKLDLVMYDAGGSVTCGSIVSSVLGVPYIGVSSYYMWWVVRNPALPSFDLLHLDQPTKEKPGFFDRLKNLMEYTVITLDWEYGLGLMTTVRVRSLLERHIQDKTITTWNDMNNRAEMLFILKDELLERPFPKMPHIVDIACVTCWPPKPLPNDLETLVSSNRYGTILMTFGSMVDNLPDDRFAVFLESFRQLKYLVLWRYNGDITSKEIPRNIKWLEWIPQNDVLGHPNTKLFITHCGNNGQHESIYHGVPMLGFPLHAEQQHNAVRMAEKDYGIYLDILTFTSKDLVKAINTIIGDRTYTMNAKMASDKLKTRPMNARDKAAYWIDYILKYGGKDLRSHALDMTLVEFLMVDLVTFIMAVSLCWVLIFYCCCKWLCRYFRSSLTVTRKTKQE